MRALTFSRFGAPDVLEFIEVPTPSPGPGQVRVRTEAIGLNFADIYRRQGRYHLRGTPPWIAGYEAAGVVMEDGCGFVEGDRVAFADAPFANAEIVAVDADRLIRLPDAVSSETAAAVLLQGLTAQFLATDSYRLGASDTALVHAAAGGVGGLLMQWGRARGARMVGLVSTPAKADLLRRNGFEAIVGTSPDSSLGFTPDVVYDSTGTTLLESLAQVRPGGTVVFYGMAGGQPPLIDPRLLMDGSRRLVGGDLWNALDTARERQRRAEDLFRMLADGALVQPVAARFALAQGAAAHTLLESRTTVGKVLLLP